jgi:exoribonuclease II
VENVAALVAYGVGLDARAKAAGHHWHRLRNTNGLERLHGEIKRRIRSAGAFPDRASALRLVTAVALEATATWSQRQYLDMKLLKTEEEKRQAKVALPDEELPVAVKLHTKRDLTARRRLLDGEGELALPGGLGLAPDEA